MVFRIYVEKKPGFDIEAQHLLYELHTTLNITNLTGVRLINRYDVENIDEELFLACIPTVFSEPQSEVATQDMPDAKNASVFAVEYLPGQFDQRAESAAECIQLISQKDRPAVRSAKLYYLIGALTPEEIARIKHYIINPIEAREASLDPRKTLTMRYPKPAQVEVLDGFIQMDDVALEEFIAKRGLAMDKADLAACRDYFKEEGREPTITEIKLIDTYWSDHCRHTTFNTELTEVTIDDKLVKQAFAKYLSLREKIGCANRPISLMDMATLGARYLKKKGKLANLDVSDEVNACTVKVHVDVNGKNEDWLYLFKNETHNHPTEVEPFGGAATCIGGCIRDPLSGRSYVYQALRLTGAANPFTPISATLPGKLPQRKLVTTAAEGYSSYGNQIGVATGQVNEIYHPGYAAKRMEVGAVVGATPADHVRRETPAEGDIIVLLGGRTGRDGIGGATGSSKAHNMDSLETCGAEVQKGNAPIERNLQRLFRRKDACRLIKRCNDFGAGGVSVATGELAEGLIVDLDRVPKKYDGLDGTELALSESQERMAVALDAKDVAEFIGYATEENLEATPIATVTAEQRVRMVWQDDVIVDISRSFLDSNGAPKQARAHIKHGETWAPHWPGTTLEERLASVLCDLNVCSQKGLAERFDSTIGASTVLMPFGGRYQLTPALSMVAKLPVEGETTTVSGMSWGFNPALSTADQFRGAYLAVVESIAKLVATGFRRKRAYLTFQEYFGSVRDVPERWGKPAGALLGALMAQIDLRVGSIGGKDSMSGSFETLDVPPTLISFATAVGSLDTVTSPEFKHADHSVFLISPHRKGKTLLPRPKSMRATFTFVEKLIRSGAACAVSTPGYGCCAEALFKMCIGNRLGMVLDANKGSDWLFEPAIGSFLVEIDTSSTKVPKKMDYVDVCLVGTTTKAYELICGSDVVDLAVMQELWEAELEPIFPYRTPLSQKNNLVDVESISTSVNVQPRPSTALFNTADTTAPAPHETDLSNMTVRSTASPHTPTTGALSVRPRVIIPVFSGTNCEYDSAYAFERAGAKVTTLIINNLNPHAVVESTKQLVKEIKQSQILMIPGGFSGGDEPGGSAKFINAFFRAPAVTEAVRDLLQNRDGLILGICNGFQALVKLGLVPFGDIRPMDDTCPTLTFNTIGRHQSRLVRTRVASNLSPWLSRCEIGDIHTLPVSHGEGRFVADRTTLEQMRAAGQIATQYVDTVGHPSLDLAVTPNGSAWAIEGITSPDGRILGKMGHTERTGNGLYLNFPDNAYQPLIESGVDYFTD